LLRVFRGFFLGCFAAFLLLLYGAFIYLWRCFLLVDRCCRLLDFDFLLVTLRRQGRFQVFVENDQISVSSDGHFEPCYASRQYWPNVGAGCEVEVPSIRIKRRKCGIAHAFFHWVLVFPLTAITYN